MSTLAIRSLLKLIIFSNLTSNYWVYVNRITFLKHRSLKLINFKINYKITKRDMAQKSILSFFKTANLLKDDNEKSPIKVKQESLSTLIDDDSQSPIKTTNKRKKRVLSDSESEEENRETDDTNDEIKPAKMRKSTRNKRDVDTLIQELPLRDDNIWGKEEVKNNKDSFQISRKNLEETANISNELNAAEMNEVLNKDTNKSKTQNVRNIDESSDDEEKIEERKESVKKNRVKKEKPMDQTKTIRSTRKSKKSLMKDFSEDEKVKSEDDVVKVKKSVRKYKKSIKEQSSEEENEKTEAKKMVKKEYLGEDSETITKETKPGTKIHPFFGAGAKDIKARAKDIKAQETNDKKDFYNPAISKYHPIDDAMWKNGEKVPYLALARTFTLIEENSARLRMIEILSNYFRSVIVLSPDDLLGSIYLCLNRVAPETEGLELGVGDMLLYKAVAQATGRTVEKLKADVNIKGDLGIVAEASRSNQRIMFPPPKLTVFHVFSKLKEIAQMSGTSVQGKKIEKIQSMFVACRHSEARFLIRSLSGKLRIGLAEQSVLMAIAQATMMTPPGQEYPPKIIDASKGMTAEAFKRKLQEEALILKTTYCECPNYDQIIPVLLKDGIGALPEKCPLVPGVPLKPMLAHPTKEIVEVLRRFDNAKFTCEYKYDGERAQIHVLENGEIKIFSRNQEDNTSKYPDIITRMPKSLKESAKSCILDSEAVAWDPDKKCILPFQILSTRKRKNASEADIKVQVCIFVFDILYLNGESLVRKPLGERRELLRNALVEVENEVIFAQSMDGNTLEDIEIFLDKSIKGNCEGLMVKTLDKDATYEISKRSKNWLKLKKDYLDGVGDTLDLVVIGGYYGKGKRTGTYGGFLLACYDEDNEEFQTICKIGTGFKDEQLESHTSFLKQHVIQCPKSYYRYDHGLAPDEWFNAVQVWEVKCADFSISPIHKAAIGIVDNEKGISMRFPRFLRIREDKKPENATSASQVADMYSNQTQVKNQDKKEYKFADDEDLY